MNLKLIVLTSSYYYFQKSIEVVLTADSL